jgi:membrane protease subunit (stomatin/prohibitin family)
MGIGKKKTGADNVITFDFGESNDIIAKKAKAVNLDKNTKLAVPAGYTAVVYRNNVPVFRTKESIAVYDKLKQIKGLSLQSDDFSFYCFVKGDRAIEIPWGTRTAINIKALGGDPWARANGTIIISIDSPVKMFEKIDTKYITNDEITKEGIGRFIKENEIFQVIRDAIYNAIKVSGGMDNLKGFTLIGSDIDDLFHRQKESFMDTYGFIVEHVNVGGITSTTYGDDD